MLRFVNFFCKAVNPVAMGKTRSKQLYRRAGDYAPAEIEEAKSGDSAMCLQIHGDAAFTAQVNDTLFNHLQRTANVSRI